MADVATAVHCSSGHACGNSTCCGDDDKERGVVDHSRDDGAAAVAAPPPPPDEEKSSKLCFAVVRTREADVVMFDTTGHPRTFSSRGDTGRLCFSTHGIDSAHLLTHCFDKDGLHGTPEQDCFCGLDTPHLHAHLHDPKTCDDNNNFSAATRTTTGSNNDFTSIGIITLYPTESQDDINNDNNNGPLVRLPISEELPNQCNSVEMLRRMSDFGINPSDHGAKRRRINQVQHDDHVDYLVHDSTTGYLHLEHPNCDNCGQNDVHGLFKCVEKRRWEDPSGSQDVQIHFYEAAPKPFSIIDFIHDLFDPLTSQRVNAIRPDHGHAHSHGHHHHHRQRNVRQLSYCTFITDDAAKPPLAMPDAPPCDTAKTVRSTIVCTRICCSSEIPLINSVLEPIDGVERTLINVPLRQVSVDHDPQIVTAEDITNVLNKNKFGATLKLDGAAASNQNKMARSQFFVQHICCSSEVPAVRKIVRSVVGVQKVSISVATKMVYVEHDTVIVSAQHICDALNADKFGATLKHDGAMDQVGSACSFSRTKLSFGALNGALPVDKESLERMLGKYNSSQVESFQVDMEQLEIIIVHNALVLPASEIAKTLEEEIVINCSVVEDGADFTTWNFPSPKVDGDDVDDGDNGDDMLGGERSRPSTNVLVSGLFLLVSLLSLIGGNWKYVKYVAILSIIAGLPPIAVKAYHTLLRYQFDTNCLMTFAVLGAIALQDFVEGATVTFLFGISEWLELCATSRARTALSAIVSLRPEVANLIHPVTKDTIVVPATSVPVGALVSVKPGDKIPCDGLVIEGMSTVDESSLTGESRPVRKSPNDAVSGGTINSGSAHLIVRTTATAENSAVARLVRLVEEAQANRSKTEKTIEEFARYYTPLVVLAALLMCSIPWIYGHEVGKKWSHNGLVLIVIACPCALIISTPVAYVAGLAASAQKGVLVKGGAYLEALGLVKKVALDKTGTLTRGEFALLQLEVIGSQCSRKEVWEYLLLMEERAAHPMAQAIVAAGQREGVSIPKNKSVLNHIFLAGEGVSASINGLAVHVGNERLFQRLGLLDGLSEHIKDAYSKWAESGGTIGFMSVEGMGIVCAYCVADAVRPEAQEVVAGLERLGIVVTMLTGDSRDAALAIGAQVGLKESGIRSGLMPEEKLSIVMEMKATTEARRSVLTNPLSKPSLVLMCGDGVNDAPALASADVGVAMGAGAALAMETSDVTLLDSDLRKLIFGISMGRRVINKIKENIVFSLLVKLIVVGFALAGKTRLWAAIMSDVGAMILVTLNGMSLLPVKRYNNNKTTKKGILPSSSSSLRDLELAEEDGQQGQSHHYHHHHHANATSSSSPPPTDCGRCCGHHHEKDNCGGPAAAAAAVATRSDTCGHDHHNHDDNALAPSNHGHDHNHRHIHNDHHHNHHDAVPCCHLNHLDCDEDDDTDDELIPSREDDCRKDCCPSDNCCSDKKVKSCCDNHDECEDHKGLIDNHVDSTLSSSPPPTDCGGCCGHHHEKNNCGGAAGGAVVATRSDTCGHDHHNHDDHALAPSNYGHDHNHRHIHNDHHRNHHDAVPCCHLNHLDCDEDTDDDDELIPSGKDDCRKDCCPSDNCCSDKKVKSCCDNHDKCEDHKGLIDNHHRHDGHHHDHHEHHSCSKEHDHEHSSGQSSGDKHHDHDGKSHIHYHSHHGPDKHASFHSHDHSSSGKHDSGHNHYENFEGNNQHHHHHHHHHEEHDNGHAHGHSGHDDDDHHHGNQQHNCSHTHGHCGHDNNHPHHNHNHHHSHYQHDEHKAGHFSDHSSNKDDDHHHGHRHK